MEAAIDTYFRGVDLDRVDWISSQEVVAFFKGSSLPQPVLAHVTRSGCDEGGHRRLLLVAQAAIDPGVFYSEGSAARARRGRGRCCRRFCIGVAAPRSLICLPASRRPSDLPTPYHLPDARRLRSRAEKPDGSAPERTFFGFKPSRSRPPMPSPPPRGDGAAVAPFRNREKVWLTKWPQQIALIKLAGEGNWFQQFRVVALF